MRRVPRSCITWPESNVKPYLNLQVLTGSMPHSGCDDAIALSNIRAGKIPERPSEGIPDPIWQFLEKCWSMDPRKRPSATEFYDALSRFCSFRPGILKFEVQKIKFPPTGMEMQQFSVKFEYGNEGYTTRLTTRTTRTTTGSESTWFVPCLSLPSQLLLSPGQGPPGNLVGRNQWKESRTAGLLHSPLLEIHSGVQE